ncbi:exodeoxyribonuclease VII large subunit [Eubacteriales bacterium KG127]
MVRIEKQAITVSELNNYIDQLVRVNTILSDFKIRGEITGYKNHSSGHKYFSIKDDYAKVNCFLAKGLARYLRFQPNNGMEVEIRGQVTVYKPNGTYSIFVKSMKPSGEGALSKAFELLKNKLEKDGLFNLAHKKPIPQYPRHIGIITSETGAAIEDIISTISNKNNHVKISIFPTLVQGQYAAQDITSTIEYVNRKFPQIDVLIVGRGGGSAEDLWSFNEESVARAIFESNIPIISAVGHEIDYTISDMVADYRAETPTAAAEKAVYNSFELEEKIESLAKLLAENLKQRSDNLLKEVELSKDNLRREFENMLGRFEYLCEKGKISLEANNPLSILNKGYAILNDKDGHLVRDVKQVKEKDEIVVSLLRGKLLCCVERIEVIKDESGDI